MTVAAIMPAIVAALPVNSKAIQRYAANESRRSDTK